MATLKVVEIRYMAFIKTVESDIKLSSYKK